LKIIHKCVKTTLGGGLDCSGLIQQFSNLLCLWPISEFHSILWPSLVLFNYNKCNIYTKYICVLYQHGYLYESVVPPNTAKWIQLISQWYRTERNVASLRGPLRTPSSTPIFCFNRRGTRSQTILVQGFKCLTLTSFLIK
jgi:hypothetical protein